MMIHIAKTRARVKSIALISIGLSVDEAALPSCPGTTASLGIASVSDGMRVKSLSKGFCSALSRVCLKQDVR